MEARREAAGVVHFRQRLERIIHLVVHNRRTGFGKGEVIHQVEPGGVEALPGPDAPQIGDIVEHCLLDRNLDAVGIVRRKTRPGEVCVIADALIDFSNAFGVVVKAVKDGTFKPGTIRVGTRDNVVKFLWNEKMTIPKEARDAYDKALKDIQDGKIKINIGAY